MAQSLFYLFSGLAVLSALGVVTLASTTKALLSLIVTMFSLAVLYLLLGAPFVAMAHLIVYAGAVLVLFLFVIMLQGVGAKEPSFKSRFSKGYLFLSVLGGLLFIATLFSTISLVKEKLLFLNPKGVVGSIEAIGNKLFYEYLLPFELISVLLLVGVFAAVSLAKNEEASR